MGTFAVGEAATSSLAALRVAQGTVPVNRWLIGRGNGHAVVHQYHGGGHGPAAHEQHQADEHGDGRAHH